MTWQALVILIQITECNRKQKDKRKNFIMQLIKCRNRCCAIALELVDLFKGLIDSLYSYGVNWNSDELQ